ncbi:hypothetical protein MTP99_009389 [Tenebrio molitor]|nr:hypothetical protein MTP99_009389 [Tenebrio molitor]
MRLRRNNGQVDYRKEKENWKVPYNNKLPLMATMTVTEMILYWNVMLVRAVHYQLGLQLRHWYYYQKM